MAHTTRKATIYRMVMKEHVCPYGMKSLWLLRHYGYDVDDNWLKTREETDAFREKHNVKTTPQTFIGGKRIGGYDQLRAFFNHPLPDKNKTSYKPVAVVFIMAALLAMAAQFASVGQIMTLRAAEWFVAFSMGMLALLKLRDVESFSTMFLGYDLLARQWVPYAWLYPFGEALAALLMTAGALPLVSAPVALFIGTVGAVSVVKAVYIDKRELRCACMGGDSNVPLGFISLTENLMMIAMGVWTLVKLFI